MDRIPVAPLKSSSFSAATNREDKLARNLSLGPIKLNEHIKEAARVDNNAAGEATTDAAAVPEEAGEPDFSTLSAEIDAFLAAHRDGEPLPAISEVTLDRFVSAVEQEIEWSEGTDDKWVPEDAGEAPPLVAAIKRIAALASALTAGAGQPEKFTIGVHRVTGVLHRAMTFVEDEFHALLEATAKIGDTGSATVRSMKRQASFRESSSEPTAAGKEGSGSGSGSPPLFPPETVDKLRAMAEAMLAAGYETECTEVFMVARRNAVDASLQSLGYERSTIDHVVKMPFEALETEIATWIKAFRHAVEVDLPGERDLCRRVFPGSGVHEAIFFAGLAHPAMLQMLSFTEAVVLTKRAAEKLFKVLDMYECIRDVAPAVDALASGDDAAMADIKYELATVRSRLGEYAAAIFCDLKSSIRADAVRQPVPGCTVNPLTRFFMNYLKYAGEYMSTQVFLEHRRPFTAELMEVIELLHGNKEVKSRLHKDTYVRSIFLVNTGQYILKKIRGSPEISAVVGEAWSRKRSAELRRYYKKYQRDRWRRALTLPIRKIKQICNARVRSDNIKSCARVAPSDRSQWGFHPELDEY